MEKIMIGASFWVCGRCDGLHGQIKFSDGTFSEPCCSKSSAHEIINKQRGVKLTEYELPELRRQIYQSTLPTSNNSTSEKLEGELRTIYGTSPILAGNPLDCRAYIETCNQF